MCVTWHNLHPPNNATAQGVQPLLHGDLGWVWEQF